MKLRMSVILLAVALLTAGNVLGDPPFRAFTGRDTFLAMTDPGTITCPGGLPNPAPPAPPSWSPCLPMPGSRVHNRNAKFLYKFQASDNRMAGLMELTSANGNYDGWKPDLQPFPGAPGSGPMWGTLRLTVMKGTDPQTWEATGDVWEGIWTGTRTVTQKGVVITTHDVLFGSEGGVLGMRAEFSGTGNPATGGSFWGWILAPPGKSGN